VDYSAVRLDESLIVRARGADIQLYRHRSYVSLSKRSYSCRVMYSNILFMASGGVATVHRLHLELRSRTACRGSSINGAVLFCKTDVTRVRFVARVRDFIARDKLADAARLSSCTLRLCRANKHGFCATFPVSRSSSTNTVLKWRNCSISNLFSALMYV